MSAPRESPTSEPMQPESQRDELPRTAPMTPSKEAEAEKRLAALALPQEGAMQYCSAQN
jgi:hypothetical protein